MDLFNEVIRSSPQMAALLVIVILFLKHIDKRDDRLKDMSEEWRRHQKVLTDRSDQITNRMHDALEANTREMGRNTQVIGQLKDTIKDKPQ